MKARREKMDEVNIYDNGHSDPSVDAYLVREMVFETETNVAAISNLLFAASEYMQNSLESVVALQMEYEDDVTVLRMFVQ